MRSVALVRHCSAACSAGSMSTAWVGCWLTDAAMAAVVVAVLVVAVLVVVGAVAVGAVVVVIPAGAESVVVELEAAVVVVVLPGLVVVVVVLVTEPVAVDFVLPATQCYFEMQSSVMAGVLVVIVPKRYLLGLPAVVVGVVASAPVVVAVANAFASAVAVVAAVGASDGCA